MNAVWIALGMGIAVAALTLVASWLRGDRNVDLGSVSDQWIAEHRMGQGHEPPQ